MKYLIKESKVLSILEKYLNDIEWAVVDYDEWDMTRLFFKGQTNIANDAIFESYTEEEEEEEYDEGDYKRVLLVRRAFFMKLKSLFGLSTKELSRFLLVWYKSYTNEDVESFNFID